jgi:hypothetical protein
MIGNFRKQTVTTLTAVGWRQRLSVMSDYPLPAGGEDSQVRGFALYVGMSETKARASGLELGDLASQLKRALARRVPLVESQALAVVAPIDESRGDLEAVLLASGQSQLSSSFASFAPRPDADVVIDLARHRVAVKEKDLKLTFTEFALLQLLVRNAGHTISRARLRDITSTTDGAVSHGAAGASVNTSANASVNDRTIDVRIRRLRVKLGDYPDLIRTVPGRGYRFDPRPDVAVLAG